MSVDIFSKRLKWIRTKNQLTQVELGKMAGIPSTTIAHFEAGSRCSSLKNLIRIAKALSVSSDFLIGLNDDLYDKDSCTEIEVVEMPIVNRLIFQFNKPVKLLFDNEEKV